jgi:hypothetical protein
MIYILVLENKEVIDFIPMNYLEVAITYVVNNASNRNSAKNIKSYIDGCGSYMTPDEHLCIVDSDFDISELTKLQGALAIFYEKRFKEMTTKAKSFIREKKFKELGI